MDSFDEWVKTADHRCFQQWGQQVVELGASWDSFRREDHDAIVNDLVSGGIPILAARDITTIAAAEVTKSRTPMSVFWDLENMPIPTEVTGRDIMTSLKSILAPHGDLIQFRGYASIGLNHIPQEKRSDLQLSGCHLVDCPHHGRKEVADKMIIVDAMQFAFQHLGGAALCFITGDADYAYLLATLQRPQWRTIVISRGTMQSMLHVNCDMKMRWETDILKPIFGGHIRGVDQEDAVDEGETKRQSPVNAWHTPFRPLSADEGWQDDVELLRTVLKQQNQIGVLAPLKSLIGNLLRNTNPARFPQRTAIQAFLARAIEEGVVVENGDGALKTLCLPVHVGHPATAPSLALSKQLPPSFDGLPQRALDAAASAPYVVLLRKSRCPSGANPPSKAYVQSSTEWLLYMFSSQALALEAASTCQWLRNGTFVDLRQVTPFMPAKSNMTKKAPTADSAWVNCSVCEIMVPHGDLIYSKCGTRCYCSLECQDWINQDTSSIKNGVDMVVETLQFMAGYDDVGLPFNVLRKIVTRRYPEKCPSRRLAKLWILEAEKQQRVLLYKFEGAKQKIAALPEYLSQALQVKQPINTEEEESFVCDLLWDASGSCMDRKPINQALAKEFPLTMTKPQDRSQVFANGKATGRFFLAKGPHNQTVGLTNQDAEAALQTSPPGAFDHREAPSGPSSTLLSSSEPEVSAHPVSNGTQVAEDGSNGDFNSDSSDDDDGIDLSALLRPKPPA